MNVENIIKEIRGAESLGEIAGAEKKVGHIMAALENAWALYDHDAGAWQEFRDKIAMGECLCEEFTIARDRCPQHGATARALFRYHKIFWKCRASVSNRTVDEDFYESCKPLFYHGSDGFQVLDLVASGQVTAKEAAQLLLSMMDGKKVELPDVEVKE